jgi:nicotinamide mononucleotide adenylyltransferase
MSSVHSQVGPPRVEEGSAHGRFQPLHNEHLEYILEAKSRCGFLWIGITRFDTSSEHLNPLGRHRERPEANPLNYYERLTIIREALLDSGVPPSDFTFVPFPIETPAALPVFLPKHIVCYTTICEEWNKEKIRLLQSEGYKVEVLWERMPKRIQGTDIREWIANGEQRWKGLVPPATVRGVERFDLQDRIRRLLER